MPTPSEYADRYRNLPVQFDDGSSVNVTIERYHLGASDAEREILVQSVKEYIQAQQKKDSGFELEVIVNGTSAKTNYKEIAPHVAMPFFGKGSPEDCQIAAQLAVLTKRTTKENLPRYCDQHLGLDCNGFVGNYFFHARAGNPWNSIAKDGAALGPNSLMPEFVKAGQPLLSVDDINPANLYVFVELNSALKVIPGGSSGAGHIVISEPNKYTPTSFVVNSFGGLDIGYANKGAYGHPALWAVESTGPNGAIGLKESWYAIKRSVGNRHTISRGVYEVFRGSKAENLNFEIVGFPLVPAA